MKTLEVLFNVCTLIAFVNSHGQLSVPQPRYKSNQQASGDGFNQYYFKGIEDLFIWTFKRNIFYILINNSKIKGGDVHICGDNNQFPQSQLTGSVTQTYLSGSNPVMTIYVNWFFICL